MQPRPAKALSAGPIRLVEAALEDDRHAVPRSDLGDLSRMPERELLALDHARPRDQRELTFELHALATGVPDGTVISGCCCAGGAETPLRTLCSSAALTNPEKSGCGENGFDWNEVRMSGQLDHFHQPELLVDPAHDHALVLELRAVGVVDLVAMPVALADLLPAIDARGQRARLEHAGVRAEPHRAALGRDLLLVGHQRDHRVRRAFVELVGIRLVEAADIPREFDRGHLQAEANAEERNFTLSGVADGGDLALGPADAESAGDENRVGVLQERVRAELLDLRRVDVVERDPRVVGDPAVDQRFVQGLVALDQIDVLADHRDAHFARRLLDRLDDPLPLVEPRRPAPDVQELGHAIVETFLV